MLFLLKAFPFPAYLSLKGSQTRVWLNPHWCHTCLAWKSLKVVEREPENLDEEIGEFERDLSISQLQLCLHSHSPSLCPSHFKASEDVSLCEPLQTVLWWLWQWRLVAIFCIPGCLWCRHCSLGPWLLQSRWGQGRQSKKAQEMYRKAVGLTLEHVNIMCYQVGNQLSHWATF